MSSTTEFNQTGTAAEIQTLSRGERALALVRDSYDLHGPSAATFSVLLEALQLEPLHHLNLATPLKKIHDVLKDPDDPKTARIERIAPQIPSFKFDADVSFSSERQRGGNNPTLAKILNDLNPIDSPLPDRPVTPKHEDEVQRKLDSEDHFKKETFSILEQGRNALYREVLHAALDGNHGFSIKSNHAFYQVVANIKGGKEAYEKIPAATKALSILTEHLKGGLNLEGAVSVASRFVSEEKRLALTTGL